MKETQDQNDDNHHHNHHHASMSYKWSGLTVRTRPKNAGWKKCFSKSDSGLIDSRDILQDVSGFAMPGEVLAIMGASGAGKTTLLNVLTFRGLDGLEIVNGERYLNGAKASNKSLANVAAYVQQTDLFLPNLSVKETLWFHAQLRINEKTCSKKEKRNVIKEIMADLGLTKCADTRIGLQTQKFLFTCSASACQCLMTVVVLVVVVVVGKGSKQGHGHYITL